jgi:hypothetical protein
MAHLEFKSPHDGSLLTFNLTGRYAEGVDFEVNVKTPWFSGSAPSSTYMMTSPAVLFRDMADEWSEWKLEKKWSDLEDRVQLEDMANRIEALFA